MAKKKKNPLERKEFREDLDTFAEAVAEAVDDSELHSVTDYIDTFNEMCDDEEEGGDALNLAWYIGWLECASLLLGVEIAEMVGEYTETPVELDEEEEEG